MSVSRPPWVPNPYLHLEADGIYDPQRGRRLGADDEAQARLRALVESGVACGGIDPARGRSTLDRLARDGWLVRDGAPGLDRVHRVRYVSIETRSGCNQACFFCPVSVDPHPSVELPTELFERIVAEVAALDDPVEGVFLNGYNEPTADARYLDQVRTIHAAGLRVATLTNGTGLTPAVSDALVEMGGIAHLGVNLSTLDREAYRRDRGRDHLERVLEHLEHARDRAVADEMRIVVLGRGDARHDADHAAIAARFAGSRFAVERFVANDRAGFLPADGLPRTAPEGTRLAGCEQTGSRPIEHLHVVATGECVLCCQDYSATVVLGNLHEQSVAEVLDSEAFARARRQVYGIEEAPEDFPCHACAFALRRRARAR